MARFCNWSTEKAFVARHLTTLEPLSPWFWFSWWLPKIITCRAHITIVIIVITCEMLGLWLWIHNSRKVGVRVSYQWSDTSTASLPCCDTSISGIWGTTRNTKHYSSTRVESVWIGQTSLAPLSIIVSAIQASTRLEVLRSTAIPETSWVNRYWEIQWWRYHSLCSRSETRLVLTYPENQSLAAPRLTTRFSVTTIHPHIAAAISTQLIKQFAHMSVKYEMASRLVISQWKTAECFKGTLYSFQDVHESSKLSIPHSLKFTLVNESLWSVKLGCIPISISPYVKTGKWPSKFLFQFWCLIVYIPICRICRIWINASY